VSDQTDDAVIRYGVKELLALQGETLKRIEGKVDTNALSQAEAIGKIDLRVSLLEAPKLEQRIASLEKFRYTFPSVAVLSLLVSGLLAIYYLTHG
jgi:ABC-type proline/glycine betaine transport system permease subunit